MSSQKMDSAFQDEQSPGSTLIIPKTQDKPDDIDARIRLKIYEEVRSQIDRERTLFEGYIGRWIKLIGFAMFTIGLVLTILAIRSIQDVKKIAVEYVESRVEVLINGEDSQSNVRNTLRNALNRAMVASVLASRADRGPSPTLTDNEYGHLRMWIKDKDLDEQQFADALAVLAEQSESGKKRDALRLFSEMINPGQDSQYTWMLQQPDKRHAILNTFLHPSMGPAVLQILIAQESTEDIRIACAEYLRQIHYSDANDKLIPILERQKDDSLRESLFVACAALDPSNDRLHIALQKMVRSSEKQFAVQTGFEVLVQLWGDRQNGMIARDNNINTLTNLLLPFVMQNGGGFWVLESKLGSRIRDYYGNFVTPARELYRVYYQVPSGAYPKESRDFGSVETFKRFEPYWTYLATVANSNDVSQLNAVLPRVGSSIYAIKKFPIVDISLYVSTASELTVHVPGEREPRILKGETVRLQAGGELFAAWGEHSATQQISGKVLALKGNDFRLTVNEF